MARDSQREKVYQAEFALRHMFEAAEKIGNPMVTLDGIPLVLPPEGKFGDVASIQAYVDRVLAAIGHGSPVSVRQRHGLAKAHYEMVPQPCIAIPDRGDRWAMREIVVLHEIAHHLAQGERHGPVFVATFNDLLTTIMGPQVGLAYRILCNHEGVKEGVRA